MMINHLTSIHVHAPCTRKNREKEKSKDGRKVPCRKEITPKWKEKKLGNAMLRKATKVHVYVQCFSLSFLV